MTDTPRTTAPGPQAPATDRTGRRRPWLIALAAGLACAVCLVPGLLLGGALAGIGAAVAGWWWVAALIAIATVVVLLLRRRGTVQATTCGCGDC